jgi:hypothetical protein
MKKQQGFNKPQTYSISNCYNTGVQEPIKKRGEIEKS